MEYIIFIVQNPLIAAFVGYCLDMLDLTVFGPNVPQWKFFGVVGFVISIIMILG